MKKSLVLKDILVLIGSVVIGIIGGNYISKELGAGKPKETQISEAEKLVYHQACMYGSLSTQQTYADKQLPSLGPSFAVETCNEMMRRLGY